MAENEKGQAQQKPAQQKSAQGGGAPRGVGRQQPGESLDGPLTTRVPRGVGELPADAKSDEPGIRRTQDSVQRAVDEANEQGFLGDSPVTEELRSAYTVAGVTSGAPTPETTVYTPRGRQ